MPLRFSDAATSILSSSITTTTTSIVLESVASFPQNMVANDFFIAVIANTENTVRETIKVTAINYTTKTLTVIRGYDSTTPIAWSLGAKIEIRGGSSLFKEMMKATMEMVYPVGSVYTNAGVNTNPSTLLGFGTWTAYASGRVLVGVNLTDPAFDQLEEIGGSKDAIVVSHTHTASSSISDPGHTHTHSNSLGVSTNLLYDGPVDGSMFATGYDRDLVAQSINAATTGISVSTSIASTGSSGANANLPPYITVYMWKRTA
jgi:hypothetical protein